MLIGHHALAIWEYSGSCSTIIQLVQQFAAEHPSSLSYTLFFLSFQILLWYPYEHPVSSKC